MFKKFISYPVFVVILFSIICIILFGAVLRHHYLGGNNYPTSQKIAVFFAEIPSIIKKMLNNKTDIIITSGAVSAGKYDYIPSIVKTFKLSDYFKSVAIRPGKPILFAKIKSKQKVIFGLPGNPMSSAACFRFFVIPYMANALGLSMERPVRGILKNSFIKKKKFTRFAKSKLSTTKDGKIEIEILNGQESFRVKSFVKSNIWALLPAGKSKFKKGDIVDCFFPNHSNQNLI